MRAFSRIVGDRRGVAAVEFAIVASVLVTLLLGVVDFVPALLAKMKSANATSSAADLTTQFQQLKASDLADIYAGASDVLAPFSGTSLILRVTNVYSDGKGNAFVYWSCGQGTLAALSANSAVVKTPSGDSVDVMLKRKAVTYGGQTYSTANTSYVVVETSYSYTAPARYVLQSALTLTNVAYALPRLSSYVGFPWNGDPTNSPTAPVAATKTGSITLSNGAVCNYAY